MLKKKRMPRPKKLKPATVSGKDGPLIAGQPRSTTISTGIGQSTFQDGIDLYNNFRPPGNNVPVNEPAPIYRGPSGNRVPPPEEWLFPPDEPPNNPPDMYRPIDMPASRQPNFQPNPRQPPSNPPRTPTTEIPPEGRLPPTTRIPTAGPQNRLPTVREVPRTRQVTIEEPPPEPSLPPGFRNPSILEEPTIRAPGTRFDPRMNVPDALREPETPGILEGVAAGAGRVAAGVGRAASTAGRAVATAAGEAGVAAGEALAGVGGAIGLEGGAAMLAGGGIIGAGILAAGLLGYGVYLLGKRLHDKFKAVHDKHGQEAALAALARKVESDRGLRMKFEKNLSPEDMQVLNDHITLHTEVDLGTAKRKKTDSSSGQKDEIPEKEERRTYADDSTSTIHGMYKQSKENTSTSQIADTPTNKSSTESKNTSNDIPTTGTPAEDKQMFQPPEPEKPINVAPQQPPQQPPPQQPRQSFQDNSINSIRPLNTQQQPRLSAEQYQYVRQRDPGYMV